MGINLEAVMANTAAVQNISMAFGRYTVRKRIQEQLISMTKKLKLTSLQLDVQFQTLLSDVIALVSYYIPISIYNWCFATNIGYLPRNVAIQSHSGSSSD